MPTYGADTVEADEADAKAREERGDFIGMYTRQRAHELFETLTEAQQNGYKPEDYFKIRDMVSEYAKLKERFEADSKQSMKAGALLQPEDPPEDPERYRKRTVDDVVSKFQTPAMEQLKSGFDVGEKVGAAKQTGQNVYEAIARLVHGESTSPADVFEASKPMAGAYFRAIGGTGELGAAGGRAAKLPLPQRQEMMKIIQERTRGMPKEEAELEAELIRGWFNEEEQEFGKSELARIPRRNEVKQLPLPQELPTRPKPHQAHRRVLGDDMIDEARERMAKGESLRSVADDLGVSKTTLSDRLRKPYTSKSSDEMYAGSPRASPLNNPEVRELIYTMKQSGETYGAIAKELQKRFPDQKITYRMVEAQLYDRLRAFNARSAAVPLPGEVPKGQWQRGAKADVGEFPRTGMFAQLPTESAMSSQPSTPTGVVASTQGLTKEILAEQAKIEEILRKFSEPAQIDRAGSED